MSKVKVNSAQKCRAYDLVMDDKKRRLHHEITMSFLDRGVLSPHGGSSGPLFKDYKVVPGKFRMVFFLAEEVCDEYEKKMGMKFSD